MACISFDEAADKSASTLSGSKHECKTDPAMCVSSPSSSTPGCGATAVNLTEDILSSFMCTPPSHKHKKGVIRRRLHAISTKGSSPDDGDSALDSWLTDEPRGSSERVTRQEPVACTHEAIVSDFTVENNLYPNAASTRPLETGAATEMANACTIMRTRKRLSPLIDHPGADAEVPIAAGTDALTATSRLGQGSEPAQCVFTPELISGSLMAKRRKFRYPRPALKGTSLLGFLAQSSSMNQDLWSSCCVIMEPLA